PYVSLILCDFSAILLSRQRSLAVLFPYTTLFRSRLRGVLLVLLVGDVPDLAHVGQDLIAARLAGLRVGDGIVGVGAVGDARHARSEEHTSELQSRFDLVCRLLLEKKNITCHNFYN